MVQDLLSLKTDYLTSSSYMSLLLLPSAVNNFRLVTARSVLPYVKKSHNTLHIPPFSFLVAWITGNIM